MDNDSFGRRVLRQASAELDCDERTLMRAAMGLRGGKISPEQAIETLKRLGVNTDRIPSVATGKSAAFDR